jgi:hypothetical protein
MYRRAPISQSPVAEAGVTVEKEVERTRSRLVRVGGSPCGRTRVEETRVFKQICFFKKRPDMTMEQFMDYYENQHSQLSKKVGTSAIPNAVRYVRRYLTPVTNPVTGEIHDPGYDCIMEIWWNSKEDFENSQRIIASPERLPHTLADEKNLFATHANPICAVEEHDSPVGPEGKIYNWVPT